MGTGSSVPLDNGKESRNKKQSNIRSQFKKEFGTIKKDDLVEDDFNNNDNLPDEKEPTSSQQLGDVDNRKFVVVGGSKLKNTNINPSVFKARRIFLKPITKSKASEQNLVIKKPTNGALLKELYKRMDPSVNKLSVRSIVGEAEVAIKYNVSERCLLVKIGRAKGLHADDLRFPSPFIIVDLYQRSTPNEKLTQQTRTKNSTCNPIFQEILIFPMGEESIANSHLKISIWDKISGRDNDFLGETVVDLCKLNLNSGNLLWYKLKPQTDVTITGDLDVTLTFDPSINNLKVLLHSANNVKVADNNGATSFPYVRVYVTGIPAKQESKVMKETLNPEWEELFEFDVHAEEFSRRIVILTVLSENQNGGKAISLGDVHIPLVNLTPDDWGVRKTYPLEDLRNAPYVRSKWSEEGISMEFKEAMKAHAIYGYPKFLFKDQHQGKMVVSCYSEKARTQAKMVISNGRPTFEEVQM
ncbi:synaptotagmin-5-like [Clytia hemisphaerica]|uniref:C2 domain-containing protein n=1 Tax=Clytia hemisphaerica TaxID=252671 RepID=A0A7M5UUS1_9CNID